MDGTIALVGGARSRSHGVIEAPSPGEQAGSVAVNSSAGRARHLDRPAMSAPSASRHNSFACCNF